MCQVFEVSRSGYYNWLKNKDFFIAKEEFLNAAITTAFEASRKTYGSPRVLEVLQKKNIEVSASTVARRMKALEISPRRKKRFKNTTDSNHGLMISPNLLNRSFTVTELGLSLIHI